MYRNVVVFRTTIQMACDQIKNINLHILFFFYNSSSNKFYLSMKEESIIEAKNPVYLATRADFVRKP